MKKRKKKSENNKYPFYIHACQEFPGYPTHTHGLTKIGMPEFLIDPLAFGPKGNAGLINRAYEFFIKPENKDKLISILNGEIIKLTSKDLRPESGDSDRHIYCFREVPAYFEAVNMAYFETKEYGKGIFGMRFIQIWVAGDDFALTDEYYRDGVKW